MAFGTVTLPLSVAVETTSALALEIAVVDPQRRRLGGVHDVLVGPLQVCTKHSL